MDKITDVQFESVGDQKSELGFQLVKMEDLFPFKTSASKNPFQPHRINFFALLLLTEGVMTHEVDFTAYKMVKGDCLFIAKEQIHKFDELINYKGYALVFTEAFMLHHFSLSAASKISFFYNYHLSPSLFKDFGDQDILINALKRELSFELGEGKADVVAAMITVFLLKAQLRTNYAMKPHSEDYEQFFQFQKLVATKYMATRAAKDYTALLNITLKQLNKLCLAFTKKTGKEYIDHYIVLEAKRQLATTKLQIKQVAYACGFTETTNFLKFFKKIAGISPSQFRELRA